MHLHCSRDERIERHHQYSATPQCHGSDGKALFLSCRSHVADLVIGISGRRCADEHRRRSLRPSVMTLAMGSIKGETRLKQFVLL